MTKESISSAKWREFKDEIVRNWGKVEENDLERARGNIGAIENLIQAKYDLKKAEIKRRLQDILVTVSRTPNAWAADQSR